MSALTVKKDVDVITNNDKIKTSLSLLNLFDDKLLEKQIEFVHFPHNWKNNLLEANPKMKQSYQKCIKIMQCWFRIYLKNESKSTISQHVILPEAIELVVGQYYVIPQCSGQHGVDCNKTFNLWLNLMDGYIGCGRKLYGNNLELLDIGGNGCGLAHWESSDYGALDSKLKAENAKEYESSMSGWFGRYYQKSSDYYKKVKQREFQEQQKKWNEEHGVTNNNDDDDDDNGNNGDNHSDDDNDDGNGNKKEGDKDKNKNENISKPNAMKMLSKLHHIVVKLGTLDLKLKIDGQDMGDDVNNDLNDKDKDNDNDNDKDRNGKDGKDDKGTTGIDSDVETEAGNDDGNDSYNNSNNNNNNNDDGDGDDDEDKRNDDDDDMSSAYLELKGDFYNYSKDDEVSMNNLKQKGFNILIQNRLIHWGIDIRRMFVYDKSMNDLEKQFSQEQDINETIEAWESAEQIRRRIRRQFRRLRRQQMRYYQRNNNNNNNNSGPGGNPGS